MEQKFNIRVYGIFINEKKEVLVSDEKRFGVSFTKFPGGGLEFGEGTISCLKRECREELGQEIEALEHFYTTDYFQKSAFNKNHQIISIYYFFRTVKPFKEVLNSEEKFRWVSLKKLTEVTFKFPIDRKVARLLKKKFLK